MLRSLLKQIIPVFSEEQIKNSRYQFNLRFFAGLVWLITCTYLIYDLQIEKNYGFHQAAVVLSSAFLAYLFIPLKWRKLFLVLVAFALEIYLLGYKIGSGVFIFLTSLTFLTYIKSKIWRNTIAVVVTTLSILVMSQLLVLPYMRMVLLFGAMFVMLRYIYFLYELNYFKEQPQFIDRLGYFFMIPNACFPLFPAIDPKTFFTSFYTLTANETMFRALHNITIGIVHLVIYRVVYFYFTPSAYDIEGFKTWLVFILSSYSLIFRLSGLFFIAVGFSELFGYKFQKVFDNVYFATGFADMWRRVNLHWRAFMMRVFYYPVSFLFKKYDQTLVVLICTNVMFAITWFLHAWQWYWIKGTFLISANDILFWFILGFLVSVNSAISFRQFKKGNLGLGAENTFFISSAKMVGLFFIMSLLWSLWTSTSLSEFVYILKFGFNAGLNEFLYLIFGFIIFVIIAAFVRYLHFKKNMFLIMFEQLSPARGITLCAVFIIAMQLLDLGKYHDELVNFKSMALNNRDKSVYERGYYDLILNNDEKSIALFNSKQNITKWNVDNKAYKKTGNVLIKEFKPDFITTFKGDTLKTNSYGLRDKDYSLIKESGVVRYSFVGGSYVMGSGVSNNENFAALLEDKLNHEGSSKTEILNFGAGGYHLIQCVKVTETKVHPFKPDYLFYFIHSSDRIRCLEDFVNLVQKGVNIDYPYLTNIVEKAQLKVGMCRLEIYNRLKPYINDIMEWGYGQIKENCSKNNTIPVAVYLPTQSSLKNDVDKEYCLRLAETNKFKVIDLSDVYRGYRPEDIQLAPWDAHPNEKGHKIISDKLYIRIKNIEKQDSLSSFN